MVSLKIVMRANAISCLVFGGIFALQPSVVATFLSVTLPIPATYMLVLGILLIANGLHLIWASRAPLPSKMLILYFSMGDYTWAIASVGLMVSGVWITTMAGVLAASAVAVMVMLFGALQMASRKAMGNCEA